MIAKKKSIPSKDHKTNPEFYQRTPVKSEFRQMVKDKNAKKNAEKVQISKMNKKKSRISSKSYWKNTNFFKMLRWWQMTIDHRKSISFDQRPLKIANFLKKPRKQANFVKNLQKNCESKNVNFVKEPNKKR